MNKKILVLTMSAQQSSYEVNRLVEEAGKLGVEVSRVLYKELSFEVENGKTKVLACGKEINEENTLAVWCRVAGTESGKYIEGRNLLLKLLKDKIFCANEVSYLSWPRMGKISQHGVFVVNDISVVPTKIFYTREQVLNPSVLRTSPLENGRNTFFGWEYPIICKHERGFQGKSVRKINNEKELKTVLKKIDEKSLGMYLWQKCLSTRWDMRVIVLGGKTLGAMKRSAVGDEFRSNFSLGGEVESWEISKEDSELAEKVAQVCGLDYCGVDIMKDEFDNSYVLEVNRQCQFQGFEKATKINTAKAVVEILVEKAVIY
ncbi:MAG: ATP-grasp domain-containing protein [Candidatus Shapirobacteria bacterium]|nr:ATP-grasp domain-containing protein [Candidatus Shapirobacteria bacterium]